MSSRRPWPETLLPRLGGEALGRPSGALPALAPRLAALPAARGGVAAKLLVVMRAAAATVSTSMASTCSASRAMRG
jgi:hypothetical protein